MQRLGVSADTCCIMFGTLQELQHFVSTTFGTITESYGAIEVPLQGVGQGNGAGSAIWLVMTISLINMLRSQGYGLPAVSAMTLEELYFVCYTFVDDTNLIHSPIQATTTSDLVGGMQKALDLWNGGLQATGGQLALAKSYWVLINLQWNSRRQEWCYKNLPDCPGSLTIKNSTGKYKNLTQHSVHHAEEPLGLWISLSGYQDQQILAFRKKIANWADRICCRCLTAFEGG